MRIEIRLKANSCKDCKRDTSKEFKNYRTKHSLMFLTIWAILAQLDHFQRKMLSLNHYFNNENIQDGDFFMCIFII